jgi:hypothetical protein
MCRTDWKSILRGMLPLGVRVSSQVATVQPSVPCCQPVNRHGRSNGFRGAVIVRAIGNRPARGRATANRPHNNRGRGSVLMVLGHFGHQAPGSSRFGRCCPCLGRSLMPPPGWTRDVLGAPNCGICETGRPSPTALPAASAGALVNKIQILRFLRRELCIPRARFFQVWSLSPLPYRTRRSRVRPVHVLAQCVRRVDYSAIPQSSEVPNNARAEHLSPGRASAYGPPQSSAAPRNKGSASAPWAWAKATKPFRDKDLSRADLFRTNSQKSFPLRNNAGNRRWQTRDRGSARRWGARAGAGVPARRVRKRAACVGDSFCSIVKQRAPRSGGTTKRMYSSTRFRTRRLVDYWSICRPVLIFRPS